MSLNFRRPPPAWFWIISSLLLLWGAAGCYACVQQFRLGAEAWGDPAHAEYNRVLYAALPVWFNYVYAAAVGAALLGAVALLAQSAKARMLFAVSLIAVVVQFGYSLFATDLVAHKGAAATLPFPLFILAVAVFSVWFAARARRRRWIG